MVYMFLYEGKTPYQISIKTGKSIGEVYKTLKSSDVLIRKHKKSIGRNRNV